MTKYVLLTCVKI